MPTPTKGPRLGGSPSHERLILANLATALFEHGRITTTEAKAKRLRPLAERLITFAKRGDLHARRHVLTVVRRKDVVHTLFAEIGPRYDSRAGGYTRITKLGPRKGDNAPMAVIELVEAVTGRQSVVREGERARGTRFARRRGGRGSQGAAGTDAAAQAAEQAERAEEQAAAAADAQEAGDTEGAVAAAGRAEDAAQRATDAAAAAEGDPAAAEAAGEAQAYAEIAEEAATEAAADEQKP